MSGSWTPGSRNYAFANSGKRPDGASMDSGLAMFLGAGVGAVAGLDEKIKSDVAQEEKVGLEKYKYEKQLEVAKYEDALATAREEAKRKYEADTKRAQNEAFANEEGPEYAAFAKKSEKEIELAKELARIREKNEKNKSEDDPSKSTSASKKIITNQAQQAILSSIGVDDIGEGFDSTWNMFRKEHPEVDSLFNEFVLKLERAKYSETEDAYLDQFMAELNRLLGKQSKGTSETDSTSGLGGGGIKIIGKRPVGEGA